VKNKKAALKEKEAGTTSTDQATSINILSSSSSNSSSSSSSSGSTHPLPSARQQLQLPAMAHDGVAMRSVLGGAMAQSVAMGLGPTRLERFGDLTTDEHEVVKRVAEDLQRQGKVMCHKAVMTEYHRVFPGFTRSHVNLMRYWKTYKTGATWRDVVARIAREKQQQKQSQPNHK
jgi:hypothetical protein